MSIICVCFLLVLATFSLGETTPKSFEARFELSWPSLPKKGTMIGKFYYSASDDKVVEMLEYDNGIKEYYDFKEEIMFRANKTHCSSFYLDSVPEILYGEPQKESGDCTVVPGKNNVTSLCIQGSVIKNITYKDGSQIKLQEFAKKDAKDPIFKKPDWKCPEKVCYAQMDLVLVIDGSASVDTSWITMKDFARNVTARFVVDKNHAWIGIVTFATKATNISDLVYDRANLYTQLTTMRFADSWTCIGCGLNTASDVLEKSTRKKERFAIVITDGYNNQPVEDPSTHLKEAVKRIKNLNTTVLVVSVGKKTVPEEMKLISSTDTYFHVADFEHLFEVLGKLTQAVCGGDIDKHCQCPGFCGVDNICLCPSACPPLLNKCEKPEKCNSTHLFCSYKKETCEDSDGCTIDSCNEETGECSNDPVDCEEGSTCISNSPSDYYCSIPSKEGHCSFDSECPVQSEPCLISVCVHNKCQTILKNCDDHDSCTEDTCVEGFCIHNVNLCSDNNVCTDDICDPVSKECVHIDKCKGDRCHVPVCDPETGCGLERIECKRPEKDPECYVTECTLEKGCVSTFIKNARKEDGSKCKSNWSVALIAVISSIGFIIAIMLICLAIFGICLYRRARRLAKREQFSRLDSVKDNELYVAAGGGGENPLYEGRD